MFYEFYTLLKVHPEPALQETKVIDKKDEAKDNKSESDEEAGTEEDFIIHNKDENPYAEFLDNVADAAEEETTSGLMGGLKSWLGFAGSMTGQYCLQGVPKNVFFLVRNWINCVG